MMSGITLASPKKPCSDLDMTPYLLGNLNFKHNWQDTLLQKRLEIYIDWLSSLGTRDAQLVQKYMHSSACSIDKIANVYHEMIELQAWLDLGHQYEQILNIDYYQTHYTKVYPIAHKKAIRLEIDLLNYFAKINGLGEIPALAFTLVNPLIEEFKVNPQKILTRLKFNREFLEKKPSCSDIKRAALVYQTGGYLYKNKEEVIRQACLFEIPN
ncbi:MAG: hypothetical protein KDD61_05295 [Bdellovibrionales bacterium]|nr:hypothetical protein [Bdellovibrionales bacterium]